FVQQGPSFERNGTAPSSASSKALSILNLFLTLGEAVRGLTVDYRRIGATCKDEIEPIPAKKRITHKHEFRETSNSDKDCHDSQRVCAGADQPALHVPKLGPGTSQPTEDDPGDSDPQ